MVLYKIIHSASGFRFREVYFYYLPLVGFAGDLKRSKGEEKNANENIFIYMVDNRMLRDCGDCGA